MGGGVVDESGGVSSGLKKYLIRNMVINRLELCGIDFQQIQSELMSVFLIEYLLKV